MRHHKKGRAFARVDKVRIALIRSLACSLVNKEKIKTTEARAKELRPFIEKIISKARVSSPSAIRLVSARLGNAKGVTVKLFKTIGPRYTTRNGGYTRITKLPARKSDGSKMAVIEFV